MVSNIIEPDNRINADWQFRCAPLPAGYAEPYTKVILKNYDL